MANKRPFRFGVGAFGSQSRSEWVELACKVEALGFSTMLVADHYVNPISVIAAISVASAVTSTLRVGSYVFSNDFRHPAMLAKEMATLDLLSDGRVEIGLGAGWLGPDYELVGIPLEPPGVRVGKLEEALQIIKGLFGEEPVHFAGQYYTINGLRGRPTPVQRPHPPIMVAGGSKRVLSIAAREADIVGLHLKTHSDGSGGDAATGSDRATLEKLEWIRRAAGERFDRLELNVLVPCLAITDNPRQTAEELATREDLATMADGPALTPELLLETPNALIGTIDGIVETLEMRRERYGISYIVVSAVDADKFAPIVARLSGK